MEPDKNAATAGRIRLLQELRDELRRRPGDDDAQRMLRHVEAELVAITDDSDEDHI